MFKVIIERYRNLIVLVWCFSVLIIFKIFTDFHFENGSSILFLFILLCVPASLQLNYYLRRQYLRKLKKASQKTFFGQIQYDFISEMINTKLIYALNNLGKDTTIAESEENIVLKCGNHTFVIITFNAIMAKIEIENTKILYRLYYDRVVFETTPYDQKGFKYYNPQKLYKAIIEIIRTLKNDRLFYQETYQGKKLLSYRLLDRAKDERIIYEMSLHHAQLLGVEETLHENRIIV